MTGQDNEDDRSAHIVLSRELFLLLFGSAITGGFGISSFVTPQTQAEAFETCMESAKVALEQSGIATDVAKQHGEEFNGLRRDIAELRNLLGTMQSRSDAREIRDRSDRAEALQDRRLDMIEAHQRAQQESKKGK